MSKKITFISLMAGFPWGGSEELWSKTAIHAANNRHSVFVNLLDWDPKPFEYQRFFNVQNLEVSFRPIEPSYSLANRLLSRLGLHKLGFLDWGKWISKDTDLLVINQGGSFDFCWHPDLRDFILKNSIPFVLINQHNTEYNPISENWRQIAHTFIPYASKVYFVSNRNKEVFEIQTAGPILNSEIVHNPFKVDELDNELGFPSVTSEINIAIVARLDTAIKNQHLILLAFSKIGDLMDQFSLNFYGTGPDNEYLHDLVRYLKLEKFVHFHGQQTVENIWGRNHVLLLPSNSEGTSLSIIEAMFFKRAVIVSNVGGAEDLVIDGENGKIISPFLNEIIAAFEWLVNNKNNLKAMGDSGYDKIRSIYKNDPIESFFNSLLQLV